MLLRSGHIKQKMANNGQVEPEQENLNFEEARGLPNPEINFVNLPTGQSITQNSTGTIPKIINRSAGRGRGFRRTNEDKRIQNNPIQSLLWDGIDLPIPDISKSANP